MLKTWRAFLVNQLNKSYKVLDLFKASLLSLAFFLPKTSHGLISNYSELVEINRLSYEKKIQSLQLQKDVYAQEISNENFQLSEEFLYQLFSFTPENSAFIAAQNKCHLFRNLYLGMMEDYNGLVSYVHGVFKTKEDNKLREKEVILSLPIFLEKIAFKQCPQIKTEFSSMNLSQIANNLKLINNFNPKERLSCQNDLSLFLNEKDTPYLCYINDRLHKLPELNEKLLKSEGTQVNEIGIEVRTIKNIDQNLTRAEKNRLKLFCENISNGHNLCEKWFERSYWREKFNSNKNPYPLFQLCQEVLEKNTLNESDYQACIDNLQKDPSLCYNENFHTKCNTLETLLWDGRLKANYIDCPNEVIDLNIINITRILNHFSQTNSPPEEAFFCSNNSTAPFMDFVLEKNDESTWGHQLCYFDKIKKIEVCHAYLLGDKKNHPYSTVNIVKKILVRTKGFSPSSNCQMISNDLFDINQLNFQFGCFVLYDKKNCTFNHCPLEFFLDKIKLNLIEQKNNFQYTYFYLDPKKEKFSLESLLTDTKKLKFKTIRNVNFLKNFFIEKPKGIIHGILCLEDIEELNEQSTKLNSCHPIPFIIDGLLEEKGYYSLIVRLSTQSVHRPILLPWRRVYQGVLNFQKKHPLKKWTMGGIYNE
jgi:hypothetical protein